MKLSEAIREGSKLKPQSFNGAMGPGIKTSCSLAAATEAYGLAPFECWSGFFGVPYGALADKCKPLAWKDVPCPECGKHMDAAMQPFFGAIWHLNDKHRWTREQVADWVAIYE